VPVAAPSVSVSKPALGIPGPGDPITKGKEKAPLPKDSHITIE
jgi:hypothetical protein